MSLDPQNETASEEQWMVAIAPGNVQMMDVEQLDAAYQAGQINDNTMVWTQGMDAWLPLAQVIGGDDSTEAQAEPAVAAPAPVAAPIAVAPIAVAPVAVAPVAVAPVAAPIGAAPIAAPPAFVAQQQAFVQQQVDATARAWQQQADVAAAAAFAQGAAALQSAVAHQVQPAPQAVANYAPVTASGFPPVAAQPAFRPSASGFPQAVSAFPAPKAPPVPSTVPVAMNLDSLDLGSLDMPKKKSKFGLIAAAALLLGAGGVTAMNLGGGKSSEKPMASAAAALHPAEGGDKPISTNDPNAPLNMGNGGYAVTDAEKQAFAKEAEKDAEMRDKMAAALTGPNGEKADTSGKGNAASAKAAASAMKAKFGGGGGGGKKARGGSGSGVSKGGSSFDPLNGDI